jgi:hypothetical protein
VTQDQAQDELYGIINATITASIPAVVPAFEIRWPGLAKLGVTPPTDDFYGRPQLTTIRDIQSSLSKNEGISRYEALSQLLFQIFSPISVAGADAQGLKLAIALQAAFRRPSPSGWITFTNQQVRQIGNNDTHYIINVIVDCTYDNIQ